MVKSYFDMLMLYFHRPKMMKQLYINYQRRLLKKCIRRYSRISQNLLKEKLIDRYPERYETSTSTV